MAHLDRVDQMGQLGQVTNKNQRSNKITALVCSGGGMQGVATIGAIQSLQERGALGDCRVFAGTSIGSVIATMCALGKDLARTVQEHMIHHEFKNRWNILNIDVALGVDSGQGIREWIHQLFPTKITFRQVHDVYGKTLIVCATNLNCRSAEYFNRHTHPDMDVRIALLLSCSVPVLFAAPLYKGCRYNDGCITDNFPVQEALRHTPNGYVLGVNLVSEESTTGSCAGDVKFQTYMTSLLESMIGTHRIVKDPRVLSLILRVPKAVHINSLNFQAPPPARRRLYEWGKQQGLQFTM
jgi:predicted acylesterase/phospholipase RssA